MHLTLFVGFQPGSWHNMGDWLEKFVLGVLNVIPLSAYNRVRARRQFLKKRRSLRKLRQKIMRNFSPYYDKIKTFGRKCSRKYLQARLISRDQLLFNGQVPAAEAFKWDIVKVIILCGTRDWSLLTRDLDTGFSDGCTRDARKVCRAPKASTEVEWND